MRTLTLAGCLAGTLTGCLIAAAHAEAPPARPDLLTFANGAIPVVVRGPGAALRVDFEKAIAAVDGDPGGFILNGRFAAPDTFVELVYALPAATVFERLAVPAVHETPSPNQTFTRHISVHGSPTGPDADLTLLGEATLAIHAKRGEVTELPVVARPPVRFVVVRLTGGIEAGAKFFEFSEIIGEGTQDAAPLATGFGGVWRPRTGISALEQDGPKVVGCLDKGQKRLTGTVDGPLLRATFVDTTSKTRGALIAAIREGELWGLRSDNGAPFRLFTAPPAKGAASPCPSKAPPTLGCDAVIHGIRFGFDSAEILPASAPILAELASGLKAEAAGAMIIEGHTSSEGSDRYNQTLSERRAQAVVADLTRRGVPAAKLRAVGIGEARPIAAETTEAGRSLNRRVEVRCPR